MTGKNQSLVIAVGIYIYNSLTSKPVLYLFRVLGVGAPLLMSVGVLIT